MSFNAGESMTSTISNSGLLIYVLADLSCIFMMLPVLRNLKTSVGSETEIQSFRFMIWSFFIYIFADLGMVFFMEGTAVLPIWLCSIITVIDEISLLLVGYFWVQFGVARLNYKYQDKLWFNILISIPFVLVAVLSITSPFSGLFFTFSTNGAYQRGPLFIVQAGVVIFYNLSVPILSIKTIMTSKSAVERERAISLLKFVVAPLSTGLVQLFNPNTPIMCLGLVVAIYFVYVDILNLQIYNDALTGLNNRRRAEIFLTDCITSTTEERPFYVFMIDVDYFKEVNDKYGHVEGDRALRIVGEALKKTADTHNGFAARMGGDEFLISTFNNSLQDPEKLITDLNAYLKKMCENNHLPYELNLSIGFAKCDNNHTRINALVNEADQMQYVRKNKHHAKDDLR